MPRVMTRQIGDLYVQPVLNQFSLAYMQPGGFVHDQVFPPVYSDKPTGIYYSYPKGTFFRTDVERRSPGTRAPRTSWRPDKKTFSTEVFHIAEDIYEEESAAADPNLELEATTTQQLTQQMMIKKEMMWADAYFKSGVWGRDRAGVTTGPTGTQFLRWDETGSDPFEMMQQESVLMLESTGFRPNTLVLTPYTEIVLANHPVFLDRVRYTGFASADRVEMQAGARTLRQALSQLFGVPRILMAEAVVNTANETLDDAPPQHADPGMHFALGKGALLVYAAPNPGIKTVSGGYTFVWSGLLGGMADRGPGAGMRMRRWWNPDVSATTIQCDGSWSYSTIATDVGVMFSDVIS